MRGLLPAILLILCLHTADAATWNVVKIGGRRYVPISDVADFYRMNIAASTGKTFKLTSPGRTLQGSSGSREVLVNGVKYILCFPLSSRGNDVLISAMDVTKIIEPVMRPGKIKSATPVKTVILDAGHGGHDSGAVGPLGREKNFTLDVALRARDLLKAAGFDVKMTRSSDTFIPLEQRAAYANRHPNAIFVSIHFNKSSTSGGTGIETYALAPRGVPSMDEKSLSYSDFKQNPGNARDAENIALAAAMHSAMVNNLRITDRGIKRARFLVIKNIKIPGVLLEGGFLNSPRDSRLIATPEFRQKMAKSILQATQAYVRSVNATEKTPPPTLVVAGDAPSSVPPLDQGPRESSEAKKDSAAEQTEVTQLTEKKETETSD